MNICGTIVFPPPSLSSTLYHPSFPSLPPLLRPLPRIRSSSDHTSGMLRQRHFCKQRDKDELRVDADRVKLMDELIQATQMRRPAILYTTRCWYRKSASASWKSKIILSWQCFSHSNDHKYEWMALGAIKAKVQLAVKCVNESVWSIYIPCRPFSPL